MMIAVAGGLIGSILVAVVINWKFAVIMLCLLPLIPLSTRMFSKVGVSASSDSICHCFCVSQLTAAETLIQLNSYAKAGQTVQEVFSSLRTVLSLNGQQFEQKR